MPTGPHKIILIHSGRYEYAEVELSGALQIVGPNNTGKTTLINSLQFLYLNDLRTMDFGYKWEQTRAFYFPSEHSYMLFECSGVSGDCVIGWRGQSKASGAEPERFCYSGPYQPDDFYDAKNQVRPPREISARLALKNFRAIKSAEEHRELLLPPDGAGAPGLGIVALRDTDKYHQFRETLKNLLTLSAITQEQMRDRVLMLAGIPPDRLALNARELFGEDYDRIRARRERLLRFKEHQGLVGKLVDKFAEREITRGELIFRWTDLRTKREAFETDHTKQLARHTEEKAKQAKLAAELTAEISKRREESENYTVELGRVDEKLKQLADGDREFAQFTPDLERAAIQALQQKARALDDQLRSADNQPRAKAVERRDIFAGLVREKEQTIARFDKVVVTALRKQFTDDELNPLFRLLNPDLLEYPVAAGSLEVHRRLQLLAALRGLISNLTGDAYHDENVTITFRGVAAPVAKVANVETVRERLEDDRQNLKRWQDILTAIEQRETLEKEKKAIQEELDGTTAREGKIRRLFRYEEHQKAKQQEKRLQDEFKTIDETIKVAKARIDKLTVSQKSAEKAEAAAQSAIIKQEDEFGRIMGEFNQCIFPEYPAKVRTPDEDIPNDFGADIALFLRQQNQETRLTDEVHNHLGEIERWFGEEFHGADELETVRLLREELEAITEKEAALVRDWNAHIHALRATFDQILKRLGDVLSARDELNRHFAKVKVSDLKAVKMEVLEHSDLVSSIRRLAAYEPGGLFEHDPLRESALINFRKKLEVSSQVRYADLFTLGFTVVGADDRAHTYHDFRQIESHGTTVTIKVLFNLLLLKSQLKRDDCQVPFFLDEIQILDPANRHAILDTARKLGFIAITAAPEAVSEVDALYFLQPRKGSIVLRQKHRVGVKHRPVSA
jgi:hypothetical protein